MPGGRTTATKRVWPVGRRSTNPGQYVKEHYTKQSHEIAMRDGVKLYTIVYSPKARGCARGEDHRGDQRGLPRVAVTYNAKVSDLLCPINLHSCGSLRKVMCDVRLVISDE